MKFLLQLQYDLRFLFRVKILILLLLFLGVSYTFAQEIKNTSSNTQESTIYDQMQEHSDTVILTPNQLEEILINELEAFDISTIPESVPMPEADWLFEVPVDVKNIPANVQNIGIKTIVHRWKSNVKKGTIDFGISQTKVKLVNGAYKGNVLMGVSYDEELVKRTSGREESIPPSGARGYVCILYVIGSDNSWIRTSKEQTSPAWGMADANQPFVGYFYGVLPREYGSEE